MDEPRDYHTKQSKLGRERQIPYGYHLHVESKIQYKQMYLRNRIRLTDIGKRLVIAKGWGREGLGVWD